MTRYERPAALAVLILAVAMMIAGTAGTAGAVTFPIPSLELNVGTAQEPEEVAVVLEIIALLTIITLAPAILILMTPFTRLVVVFHFLRQAIGTQSSPPNQVIIGLSLFMDLFYYQARGIRGVRHGAEPLS